MRRRPRRPLRLFGGSGIAVDVEAAFDRPVDLIPTLWTITKGNREVIEQAGTILLHQHPCFQRLLIDMEIEAKFVDPVFAKTGCRQAAD